MSEQKLRAMIRAGNVRAVREAKSVTEVLKPVDAGALESATADMMAGIDTALSEAGYERVETPDHPETLDAGIEFGEDVAADETTTELDEPA